MQANYPLSEQIQQTADAPNTVTAMERERRQCNHIRRLLGFEDDRIAPAWVQRVHRQMIETFGMGNGYVQ
jgi:hypothetical protein